MSLTYWQGEASAPQAGGRLATGRITSNGIEPQSQLEQAREAGAPAGGQRAAQATPRHPEQLHLGHLPPAVWERA